MRPLGICVLVVCCWFGRGIADEETPVARPTIPAIPDIPGIGKPLPPPTQTTRVLGTAPAGFTGRWLVIISIKAPGNQKLDVPIFWDIKTEAGKPVMTSRVVKLPTAIQKSLQFANGKGAIFEPSPEDLATVAADWDHLEPQTQVRYESVTTDVASPDGYDADMKADEKAKNARWIIRQDNKFDASAAPAIRDVHLFAVENETPEGISGSFEGLTLAAAPFPIPINLPGTFRAYRLDRAASGSWWSNWFAGCNRR